MQRITYLPSLFVLSVFCLTVFNPVVSLAQSHQLSDQYRQQAHALSKQGRTLEAAKMHEKSALAEQESPEPRQEKLAIALSHAGFYYYQAGKYGKSIKLHQQSLEISRKLGQEQGIASGLANIGIVYKSWGEFDKANEFYQQALQMLRGIGEENGTATLLNNIGAIYEVRSQYDKAADMYQQALEINKRLGNEAKVAIRLNSIGGLYFLLGRFDKALDVYQQALEVNKKLGREAHTATDLNGMGGVYYSLGQFDKAIDFYQQALEIDKRLGKQAGVATLLNNIGAVYKSRGEYDKAIDLYQQSLEIDKRLGREASIAVVLHNIGRVYDSWGQYDKAIGFYQRALEIDKRLGTKAHMAEDLNSIGGVYLIRGQYEMAVDYYEQALEINRRLGRDEVIAINLSNIGAAYGAWGKYDKSIEPLEQASKINKRLGKKAVIAANFYNIGKVYASRGQFDKAIDLYRQSMEINKELGMEAEFAIGLSTIGSVYKSRGQFDKAIQYYRQAIQLKEKIRKTATGDIRRDYLASQIYTYQSLASAYLNKGDSQGLLDAVEQSRARLLAERIAGIDSEMEIPKLLEVQKGLAGDEAVLLFSNIDHDNFILMVITAKEIAMEEISKESFLAKSQKQYKKPILMLLDKQRGLIPVESKGGKQAIELKKQQADFETAIHYYRTLLTNPVKREETRDFGRLLHALLIEPAGEKLAGKTKITIMPDGILGFLPFETLVDENNNYLVQKYDLRYTQSLTIDKLLQGRDYTRRDERKPLLAMGGAVYDELHYETEMVDNSKQLAWLQKETDLAIEEKRSARNAYVRLGKANWSNLPGTLKEVNKLSAIFKEGDILIGEKVTENMIKEYSKSGKLAKYKVLHFATHGLVVPELPELSAIVLSQFKNEKEGEDGYLRMSEIAKLNLAADFVNLSACETGLGKIVGGEGIVGLTQSFLIAGANGLSVSLWQVADESTAKFMTELYKKVQAIGIGYRKALTDVKRGFINGDNGEQWRSPYYWSPFVYYGN